MRHADHPIYHVYIYRLDHRVKRRRAPRRSPSNPLPSSPPGQQRANIARPIWELMNQLRVIGPPPFTKKGRRLGFLPFQESSPSYSSNALNYGHCSLHLNRCIRIDPPSSFYLYPNNECLPFEAEIRNFFDRPRPIFH